jgi:hypothetical protein
MLAQALCKVPCKNASPGGQGGGARRIGHIAAWQFQLPPKDARPKAGQKRHGFGGLNK